MNEQRSLAKVLGIWALAAAPMAVLGLPAYETDRSAGLVGRVREGASQESELHGRPDNTPAIAKIIHQGDARVS